MGDFNFNAPQYVDFTSPEELELKDYGDEYFDRDHEIEIEYQDVLCQDEHVFEDQNQTLIAQSDPLNEDDLKNARPQLRRSMSAGQILVSSPKTQDEACGLSTALDALQLSEKKNKRLLTSILPSKTNLPASRMKSSSTTKLNRPLQSQQRAESRDAINKTGLHKRKLSVESLQPNKYISVAEAINKFQFGTPLRYHSQSSKIQFNNRKYTALSHTVPQSPMLSTKQRSRAPTCVSHEEHEQMVAEEMKKNQIKAQPMNYKILRAPVLKVEKKASTVPQPFRFTEVHYKPTQVHEEVYEFHARPAPKPTKVTVKQTARRSVMPSTAPITPSYMRKYRETLPKVQECPNSNQINIKAVELQHGGVPKKIQKLVRTTIEPFSFEERNKMMQQKKEQKIKKILEEEKKAREFHARPIPAKIAGGCGHVESKVAKFMNDGSNSSLNSIKNDENIEPNQGLFKAKPATVIHKKPFIPKKEDRPLLEISEFNLNTDKRAKEREEFEKKMKEKEEEYEKIKREQEERQKLMELEAVNKIRKETVHKANPIKHYKPLEIHPSTKKITSPVSPMFAKRRSNQTQN